MTEITITEKSLKSARSNGHRMKSLSEWRTAILAEPTTDDLIQDLLPNSPADYLLLCGRSGIGKTNLALYMALCLCTGLPFFSFKTKQCKVGYLIFEGAPRKLSARIEKLESTFGDVADAFYFERSLSFKLTGKGINQLESLVQGLQVLFIDPIRYIVAGDYTKPEFASNFITALKRVSSDAGVVPVLLHHVKKPDPRLKIRPEDLQYEIKGATDYVDAAGTVLLLEKARQDRKDSGQFVPHSDDRTLHFLKVKDSPTEINALRLQFNRDLLIYQPAATREYEDETEDF